MTGREIVELVAILTIPLTIVVVIVERMITKRGLGVRAMQVIATATFMPSIIVLALEKLIDGATVAALVGGMVGYLFSNISEFDRRPRNGGSDVGL
ncbi:hypothetical protein [Sphingomonas sp.]|jgi:hypothetical protein|uniref:hypothetical protein n=1 Tax=Sphingomonas sp. TaxID=28214 RepID=UPI002DE34BD1|nr:hypothetical protein [Sphingomonas sp.]